MSRPYALPDGRPWPTRFRVSWRWRLTTEQELYVCMYHGHSYQPPLHATVWEAPVGRHAFGWNVWAADPKLHVVGTAHTREEAQDAAEALLAMSVLDLHAARGAVPGDSTS